jgi:hypothetical protein
MKRLVCTLLAIASSAAASLSSGEERHNYYLEGFKGEALPSILVPYRERAPRTIGGGACNTWKFERNLDAMLAEYTAVAPVQSCKQSLEVQTRRLFISVDLVDPLSEIGNEQPSYTANVFGDNRYIEFGLSLPMKSNARVVAVGRTVPRTAGEFFVFAGSARTRNDLQPFASVATKLREPPSTVYFRCAASVGRTWVKPLAKVAFGARVHYVALGFAACN